MDDDWKFHEVEVEEEDIESLKEDVMSDDLPDNMCVFDILNQNRDKELILPFIVKAEEFYKKQQEKVNEELLTLLYFTPYASDKPLAVKICC